MKELLALWVSKLYTFRHNAETKVVATVAQLVEHSVVIRVVAGSSPVSRPILFRRRKNERYES